MYTSVFALLASVACLSFSGMLGKSVTTAVSHRLLSSFHLISLSPILTLDLVPQDGVHLIVVCMLDHHMPKNRHRVAPLDLPFLTTAGVPVQGTLHE